MLSVTFHIVHSESSLQPSTENRILLPEENIVKKKKRG